jgi:hypothetical protein
MYGVKISQFGKEVDQALDTELVYSSEFITPKIVKNMAVSGDTPHGLGYFPCFLSMFEVFGSPFGSNSWSCGLDYRAFIGNANYVDDINVSGWGDRVLLFSDAMDDSTELEPSGYGLLVKGGNDKINNIKAFTQFDTFKVKEVNTLSLSVPSRTLDVFQADDYVVSRSHGLGYRPLYAPFFAGCDYDPLAGGALFVNDFLEGLVLFVGGLGTEIGEILVGVDETNIYLYVYRGNFGFMPLVFPQMTISMQYTIFYNKMIDDFDLTGI